MIHAITAKLPFDSETKNMLKFQLPKDKRKDSPMPTLYIAKTEFDTTRPWPAFIEVTVTPKAK